MQTSHPSGNKRTDKLLMGVGRETSLSETNIYQVFGTSADSLSQTYADIAMYNVTVKGTMLNKTPKFIKGKCYS